MAEARPKLKHELTVTIDLSADEACALGAIVGYGHEAFMRVFKEHMGKHYIRDYEHAVPGLFESLNGLDSKIQKFKKEISEVKW